MLFSVLIVGASCESGNASCDNGNEVSSVFGSLNFVTSFDYPGTASTQIGACGGLSYFLTDDEDVFEDWNVTLTPEEFTTLSQLIANANLGTLNDIDNTDEGCTGGSRTQIAFFPALHTNDTKNNFFVRSCDTDNKSEIPVPLQLLFDELDSLKEKYGK